MLRLAPRVAVDLHPVGEQGAFLVELFGSLVGIGRTSRDRQIAKSCFAPLGVLASLWSVDDSATAALMKGIYSELGAAKTKPRCFAKLNLP